LIDTYQAQPALARKDTPLQIEETRSIIEGTELVNSILKSRGLKMTDAAEKTFQAL
jgi:hypothetical protein